MLFCLVCLGNVQCWIIAERMFVISMVAGRLAVNDIYSLLLDFRITFWPKLEILRLQKKTLNLYSAIQHHCGFYDSLTLSALETSRLAACLFFRMKLQVVLVCRRTQIQLTCTCVSHTHTQRHTLRFPALAQQACTQLVVFTTAHRQRNCCSCSLTSGSLCSFLFLFCGNQRRLKKYQEVITCLINTLFFFGRTIFFKPMKIFCAIPQSMHSANWWEKENLLLSVSFSRSQLMRGRDQLCLQLKSWTLEHAQL